MNKTYVTDKWSIEVKEYEVVKETEKQIVYKDTRWYGGAREVRAAKQTEYHTHHKTLEDAIQFLIKREIDKAEHYRNKCIEHEKNASTLIARQA